MTSILVPFHFTGNWIIDASGEHHLVILNLFWVNKLIEPISMNISRVGSLFLTLYLSDWAIRISWLCKLQFCRKMLKIGVWMCSQMHSHGPRKQRGVDLTSFVPSDRSIYLSIYLKPFVGWYSYSDNIKIKILLNFYIKWQYFVRCLVTNFFVLLLYMYVYIEN